MDTYNSISKEQLPYLSFFDCTTFLTFIKDLKTLLSILKSYLICRNPISIRPFQAIIYNCNVNLGINKFVAYWKDKVYTPNALLTANLWIYSCLKQTHGHGAMCYFIIVKRMWKSVSLNMVFFINLISNVDCWFEYKETNFRWNHMPLWFLSSWSFWRHPRNGLWLIVREWCNFRIYKYNKSKSCEICSVFLLSEQVCSTL